MEVVLSALAFFIQGIDLVAAAILLHAPHGVAFLLELLFQLFDRMISWGTLLLLVDKRLPGR